MQRTGQRLLPLLLMVSDFHILENRCRLITKLTHFSSRPPYGRPSIAPELEEAGQEGSERSWAHRGVRKIAQRFGISVPTVQRIKPPFGFENASLRGSARQISAKQLRYFESERPR
jgi:hypothetical protein